MLMSQEPEEVKTPIDKPLSATFALRFKVQAIQVADLLGSLPKATSNKVQI